MTNPLIFVANDDAAFVELIKELLTEFGYPNVVWQVGQSSFEHIREAPPHLLILDINLANPARGWSTLDSVRLNPKTRHIPVIICSTDMRMINEKAEMLRNMNCQVVEKPFDIETLLDKVVAAIGPPPEATQPSNNGVHAGLL
ncbi:MAG: response regulator [Roseiflexaceae bacterium]